MATPGTNGLVSMQLEDSIALQLFSTRLACPTRLVNRVTAEVNLGAGNFTGFG